MHLWSFAKKLLAVRTVSTVRSAPEAFLFLALMLLILPLKWVGGILLAGMVHELFHILALCVCGERIYGFTIGAFGAKIETDAIASGKEFVCSLAGPMGGISLILLSRWLPCAAICAMFQSLFNLIPVVPLDGGRAVRGLLVWFFGFHRGERIYQMVAWGAMGLLFLGGIYIWLRINLGILPLIAVGILMIRLLGIKIPCKDGCERVQ